MRYIYMNRSLRCRCPPSRLVGGKPEAISSIESNLPPPDFSAQHSPSSGDPRLPTAAAAGMADVIDEPMVEAFARLALKASLAHPRVTWGRAPRKYFGRNRLWPRPQNPPGARRLRPFSRYSFTYIPAFNEEYFFSVPEVTGCLKLDALNKLFYRKLNEIGMLRKIIYMRKAYIPKPAKKEAFLRRTAEMWDRHGHLLTNAKKLLNAYTVSGFRVPEMPSQFDAQF
ncbi:hypothetical protein OsI_10114 [Oryza sativa Indica Group]|uniref:Uncharacterized protein n=1 Tax=Oryza sativa subsp. indica TaxID=39946 RepID=B8ANV6_ORYSI|nr:hypothetical protein OsI_10114 [Oryza sativa Indica Group]